MMGLLRVMAACSVLLACMGMKVDAQRIAVEIDGHRLVLPVIGGDCVLFDDDICLQPHQYTLLDEDAAVAGARVQRNDPGDVDDVLNIINHLWDSPNLTFAIDDSMPEETVRVIFLAVNEWNSKTDFNFRPAHEIENPMIRFRKTDEGCRAAQGRIEILPSTVDLAVTCDLQSVLHEIGHVVGMQHEHQRVDRGQFLTMRRDTLAYIRDHIGVGRHAAILENLKRENPGYDINLPFDLTSVMMYGSYPRNDPALFHDLYSRSLPFFTDRNGRLIPRPTFGLTGKDVLQANQLVVLGTAH